MKILFFILSFVCLSVSADTYKLYTFTKRTADKVCTLDVVVHSNGYRQSELICYKI